MTSEQKSTEPRSARRYRIAVLPGDGIGLEVVPEAITVLEHCADQFGFELEFVPFEWGCDLYLRTGSMMPADGLEQLTNFDAIFLGAIGSPSVPDHISLWGLLIPIRRHFEQYVNLRPVRLFPGVTSPLHADRLTKGIDIVIVRENNEGEYSEVGGRLYRGLPQELAVQESMFTRHGVERIARFAFELARSRRRIVMSATKSNGIIHTLPFWDELLEEVSQDFPDVTLSKMHVDALAAEFVLHPDRLDVVVGSNLFADILSDIAAAVVGGIGMAPSANLDPTRRFPSMFEPVHGSAPDIAGRGIANPIGQVWSAAMMLRHLGEPEAADAVERAIAIVLAENALHTGDLGGSATTRDVGLALVKAV